MPVLSQPPDETIIAPENQHLPVVVIGAGPIGLAAAARLAERGLPFTLFEAGVSPAAYIAGWGHVRLFTPWRYLTDDAAVRLLTEQGWRAPTADDLPTGRELIELYLEPLAGSPVIADHLVLGTRVVSVTRRGIDKVKTRGGATAPFVVRVEDEYGAPTDHLAAAVIDASGTWANPNPLGGSGVPAIGERQAGKRLSFGMPDVLGEDRADYQGKATLVVGAGHSAANVILDLVALSETDRDTTITWAVRGESLARVFGGGDADDLPARGRLGMRLQSAVNEGRLTLLTGFVVEAIQRDPDGRVEVRTADEQVVHVDQVVAATGQRPDHSLSRELRLGLDPWLESPSELAPMIDPNLHHCGSVAPHGFDVLSHPEPGFYIAGVKSYGRAPTFLMMTGYEQVRSITAALAGDMEAARNLELVLPETGICITDFEMPSVPAETSAVVGCCGTATAASESCSGTEGADRLCSGSAHIG